MQILPQRRGRKGYVHSVSADVPLEGKDVLSKTAEVSMPWETDLFGPLPCLLPQGQIQLL